jgi:hypothetical protein
LEIGKLSAEAVVREYEAAAKEIEAMGADLVERANRVRLGQLTKNSPNFVLAIGPRLVDSGDAVMHTYDYGKTGRQSAFLTVFADPWADGFAALAEALAPLAERPGLLTILFPQAGRADAEVHAKLRSLKWPVPFVFSYLSEPYTRSLMSEPLRAPAIQLQTPEGRVLFQSSWNNDAMAELSGAIDASLGQTRALVTDHAR